MPQDNSYRCEECKMDFRDQQQYDQHYAKEHPGEYRPQQQAGRMQQEQ